MLYVAIAFAGASLSLSGLVILCGLIADHHREKAKREALNVVELRYYRRIDMRV